MQQPLPKAYDYCKEGHCLVLWGQERAWQSLGTTLDSMCSCTLPRVPSLSLFGNDPCNAHTRLNLVVISCLHEQAISVDQGKEDLLSAGAGHFGRPGQGGPPEEWEAGVLLLLLLLNGTDRTLFCPSTQHNLDQPLKEAAHVAVVTTPLVFVSARPVLQLYGIPASLAPALQLAGLCAGTILKHWCCSVSAGLLFHLWAWWGPACAGALVVQGHLHTRTQGVEGGTAN
jgi:hypothetical protein